jgi:hypothetical protein
VDLPEFIRTLKPACTFEEWAELIRVQGQPVTRQALEHYVVGRRRPEAAIFGAMLTVSGRDGADREGWGLWAAAAGVPAAALSAGAA